MMTFSFAMSLSAIIPSVLAMEWQNEFDTYNVDECGKRLRRNWFSLTSDEQDQFIRGLIELRSNGFNGLELMETDEFSKIAEAHVDDFGAYVVHETSHMFFWSSYLVW